MEQQVSPEEPKIKDNPDRVFLEPFEFGLIATWRPQIINALTDIFKNDPQEVLAALNWISTGRMMVWAVKMPLLEGDENRRIGAFAFTTLMPWGLATKTMKTFIPNPDLPCLSLIHFIEMELQPSVEQKQKLDEFLSTIPKTVERNMEVPLRQAMFVYGVRGLGLTLDQWATVMSQFAFVCEGAGVSRVVTYTDSERMVGVCQSAGWKTRTLCVKEFEVKDGKRSILE